jgi:DNA-binding CsgD family transcriptional regulator
LDAVAENSERVAFETLTDLIYEAAVLPELWPAVLDQLAEIAGAQGTILIAADLEAHRWINSASLDRLMEDFVSGGWSRVRGRTTRLLGARHAGFILEEDVYTPEELERDVLIRNFLRPRGLGWGTGTAFPLSTGDTLIFSIERRFADGPVPRAATVALDTLRPHLGRAALLSARLKLERARASMQVLEMLGLPAAILTAGGRLQDRNAGFSALVPSVVRDLRERVTLVHPGADGLLAAALAARPGLSARSIPIPDDGENPALVVHILPMRGAAQDVFGGGTLLMVATPVTPRPVPGAEVLAGLFDLTAAEARIARGIADGGTIAILAAQQGVSLETIRSQLKAIFAKTGVTRQVDLARLIAGFSLIR